MVGVANVSGKVTERRSGLGITKTCLQADNGHGVTRKRKMEDTVKTEGRERQMACGTEGGGGERENGACN